MKTIWFTVLVAAPFVVGLAMIGCDGSGQGDPSDAGDTEQQDVESPQITMNNVALYQGVSGAFGVEVTATDDVGVETVELLVDGAIAASSTAEPFTISWDTTAIADGTIVPIAVRATDASGKTAESPAVPVVVVNDGYEIAFDEGSTGEISIPADYVTNPVEVDKKHHWNATAAGASRILSIVVFTIADGQTEWGIGLDVGNGWCPDSGTTLDSKVLILDGTPVVFDSQIDAGYPASVQMFFHLKPYAPEDHLGESLPYEVHSFSFN
jgi:hypothetical protein